MAINLTLPSPNADAGVWGLKLNAALEGIISAFNATDAAVAALTARLDALAPLASGGGGTLLAGIANSYVGAGDTYATGFDHY